MITTDLHYLVHKVLDGKYRSADRDNLIQYRLFNFLVYENYGLCTLESKTKVKYLIPFQYNYTKDILPVEYIL